MTDSLTDSGTQTATARPTLDASTDFVPAKAAQQAEARAYAGLIRLFGRSVAQPPRGAAVPAILVPGFISGDVSLVALARRLRRGGHRTFRSDIGANLGCTDEMVQRVLRRVDAVACAERRRVALVGHSRGGMIVKLAAQRRPDLICGIVTLCGPVTGTLSVAAHVRRQLEWLFGLHDRGFAHVISADCVTGECATRIAAELLAPFPSDVAFTSIYTEADAILDWHTCLDPAAECVAADSSHTGMATDPVVAELVAARVGALAG